MVNIPIAGSNKPIKRLVRLQLFSTNVASSCRQKSYKKISATLHIVIIQQTFGKTTLHTTSQ